MNNSPKLCTGSWLLLCVVHLVRDSCPWRSHKREVLAPPACKHSSEQLCAPCSGTEGCFDSQRRQGSYCCLCMCVYTHACTHTYTAHPPNKQKANSTYMTRNPDIHSWNCFSFLSVVPGFLLERVLYREAVFPTLGLIFRLCVALGLVLIRGRFYPKHFWLKYVRNWRVVAERRSWGWQEGLKKDSICHRTPSSWKWKTQVFFFFLTTGPITTLFF